MGFIDFVNITNLLILIVEETDAITIEVIK